MFLLVPAYPGFPGQTPHSRKTVACVCVVSYACTHARYTCMLRTHAHMHAHTHAHRRLTAFFSRTTCVSQHQKGKPVWILLKEEMIGFSGISRTICKSFAPHSRQTTMPVPHHSIFYGPDALPDALPDAQPCQSTEGLGFEALQCKPI